MFSIELKIGGVLGLRKKEMNDATKDAFAFIGRLWRAKYLPLHFGDRATQRYGYTKRDGADVARSGGKFARRTYSYRKYKLVGHTRPLEFTGDSKREALTQEKIYATKDRVIVRLPRGFNRRARGSKVRMADEIRKVRPDELAHLKTMFAKRLRETLRAMGAKRATVSANLISLDLGS